MKMGGQVKPVSVQTNIRIVKDQALQGAAGIFEAKVNGPLESQELDDTRRCLYLSILISLDTTQRPVR